MSDFKFGDLVSHKSHGRGIVVQDETETEGYLVYVKFKDSGYTHAFSRHWNPDFTYHPSHLTLVARPQAWVSLADEYPKAMDYVSLAVHEEGGKSKRTITAMWVPPKHITAPDFHWDGFDLEDDEDGECWAPSGWYEKADDRSDHACWLLSKDIIATHWMPIPKPPKK